MGDEDLKNFFNRFSWGVADVDISQHCWVGMLEYCNVHPLLDIRPHEDFSWSWPWLWLCRGRVNFYVALKINIA